jgi:hypothetical protein
MDPVFSLIKSLSQSEKRYFVRFSKFQTPATTNTYLALFNRLVKLNNYDEKLLKKEFGARHFAQLKQQLYKKLMQSLRLYYTGNSAQNEVFVHLHNYKLLTSRGLSVSAEKELKRAERTAKEGALSYESAIVFKERNMWINGLSDVFELESRIVENELFLQNQINTISNEHQYEKLFLQIELVNKQLESTRNQEEMLRVENFLQNPLLSKEDLALSTQSKIYFFFTKGLAFYLKSEYALCFSHMQRTAEILEQNENILLKQEDIYIRSLANQCLASMHLQNDQPYQHNLQKLTKVLLVDPAAIKYRNYISFILQVMFFNKKSKFAEAVQLIESNSAVVQELEKKIYQKNGDSQEKIYSVFQRAIAYLGIGAHKKASFILHQFINQNNKSGKEDAYIMARILFLFIRFELNDELLIESELRSVQRYLKEKNKLFLFEKYLLHFISKMLISSSNGARKSHFLKLQKELESLKDTEYECNAFIYFDFSEWIKKSI